MQYISTRGKAPSANIKKILLNGTAEDGGLYVPQCYPYINAEKLEALSKVSYVDAACEIIYPYVAELFSYQQFHDIVASAYNSFSHPAITPLSQIDNNLWLLELYHGPTLAFKDLALQLLGKVTQAAFGNHSRKLIVLGATSGDTGPAAIAGFAGCTGVEVFILYPNGAPSEVQRRQMTCRTEKNVHAIAIDGTFDDCQRIVKEIFADQQFRSQHQLIAVNSINWLRIAAQSVYYTKTVATLGAGTNFIIPSGNFGNAFAAETARKSGVPIGKVTIASNANDILYRAIKNGDYTKNNVHQTLAPAMDIQVSSNFERILFEISGRNFNRVEQAISNKNGFNLTSEELRILQSCYSATNADDALIIQTIQNYYQRSKIMIDPHTAVGLAGYQKLNDYPTVALACAHPVKFAPTIEQALGKKPDLPADVHNLFKQDEKFKVLSSNACEVQNHIRSLA